MLNCAGYNLEVFHSQHNCNYQNTKYSLHAQYVCLLNTQIRPQIMFLPLALSPVHPSG